MVPSGTFTVGPIEAGNLIYAPARGLQSPWLAFQYSGRLMALRLDGDDRTAFGVAEAAALSGPLLRAHGWRLEVDPASVLTGSAGSPEHGNVFLDSAGFGFIGMMNHTDIFVRLTGEMLTGFADWQSAVAFQRWRIVVDLPIPDENFELASARSSTPLIA